MLNHHSNKKLIDMTDKEYQLLDSKIRQDLEKQPDHIESFLKNPTKYLESLGVKFKPGVKAQIVSSIKEADKLGDHIFAVVIADKKKISAGELEQVLGGGSKWEYMWNHPKGWKDAINKIKEEIDDKGKGIDIITDVDKLSRM